VFGTKGVPSPANQPGRRIGAAMWGLNGKIYIQGGYSEHGSPTDPRGISDDFWEYDLSTGNWTWVGGSSGYKANGYFDNALAVDTAHSPGAGRYSITWALHNKLFLMGGSRAVANTSPTW